MTNLGDGRENIKYKMNKIMSYSYADFDHFEYI